MHLTSEDIREFLKDNLQNFEDYFPIYKGREIFGFVAGLSVDEVVARFVKRQGLYILAPSGETMKILKFFLKTRAPRIIPQDVPGR